MSVQLKADEALELLELADAQSAARWEVLLCAAVSAMGAELARIHDCEAGAATMQAGFGGLCVPLNPKHPGQPLPDGWADFEFMRGEAEEWEAEAKRLAAELEEKASDDERALSQDNAGREFTCQACGREETECSAEPCPAVLEDRGEVDEYADPCPIHRQPKDRCPAACDHGETTPGAWQFWAALDGDTTDGTVRGEDEEEAREAALKRAAVSLRISHLSDVEEIAAELDGFTLEPATKGGAA